MGSKLTYSIQRTFAILEAFTETSPRMTLQQVADKVGLPKVTAFRYLYTLMSLGYVSREADSNGYMLSPKVLHLGFTVLGGMELRQVALPYLQELSRATDQNIGLGVVDKTQVVYIERLKRRRIINVEYGVGSRVSIYRTAIGRAILAHMHSVEVLDILASILKEPEAVEYVGPKGERLLNMLREEREKGFSTNDEGYISGLRAIAAPVFDGRGVIEGAVNMSVFGAEISLEELTTGYAPPLVQTARKISYARGLVTDIREEPGSIAAPAPKTSR